MRYLLLLLPSLAFADYNGEHWQAKILWRMGSGCPEYVEQVAIEVMDKYAPLGHTYNGSLPVPSMMQKDGQNIIFCSPEPPAQAVEAPDPDITSDEAYVTAGMAKWWYSRTTSRITECDIWLRDSTLNQMTVHRFLTHEVFHCLGLQHDSDSRALMYYAPTINEAHILDKAELARLYGHCETLTDSQANLFLPEVWVDEWLRRQPQIVQDQYSTFLTNPASMIIPFGTTYPDQALRISQSSCQPIAN